MIIDSLKNSAFYYGLDEKFLKAFKTLQEINLKHLDCGTYKIHNDSIIMYIMEYETKLAEECLWEKHEKHIDIQYIISGREKIGYVNANNISITSKYNEERDVSFGEAEGNFFCINEGDFVIFTPNDGHMPSLIIEEKNLVKKAVIKILVNN